MQVHEIYEIFVPEMQRAIRFKVYSSEEIDSLLVKLLKMKDSDRIKRVTELVVDNLLDEIRPELMQMSDHAQFKAFQAMYNGCIMLNPGLNVNHWLDTAYANTSSIEALESYDHEFSTDLVVAFDPHAATEDVKSKAGIFSKAKYLNLENYLCDRVIGQDHAVSLLRMALKRSQAGLRDEGRPLGVFMFGGSSGIGKTLLAKELHAYLYGTDYQIVRIDCGEFQHKHENQKILGSPNGYERSDEDTYLSAQMLKHPRTVVLLDEIEKAHVDIFDTFLRVFDEGSFTNSKGRVIDFREAIIIMTTNLGNDDVVKSVTAKDVGFGGGVKGFNVIKNLPKRTEVLRRTEEAIKKHFKTEFLNRIDEVIIFNHLGETDYKKIAELELRIVEEKLSKRGFTLNWDKTVVDAMIDEGVDATEGARGIERVRRKVIEDVVADELIGTKCPRGTVFDLTYNEDKFVVTTSKPVKKAKTSK